MNEIMIAVNHAPHSSEAVLRSAELAAQSNRALHIVMAVRPPTATTIRNGTDSWTIDLLAAAECRVQTLIDEVRHLGVVTGTVIVANPRKAIRCEATRLDASLVLVVRKRIGSLAHRWSSTIGANGVLRHVRFRSPPRTMRTLCRRRGRQRASLYGVRTEHSGGQPHGSAVGS